MLRMQLQLSIV